MDDKSVEIGGKTFDLADPEQKKAAIRSWLKERTKAKRPAESSLSEGDTNLFVPMPATHTAPDAPEAP